MPVGPVLQTRSGGPVAAAEQMTAGGLVPYPDRLLAADERVIAQLHPHWITLCKPVAILIVDAGVASFLAAIVPGWRVQAALRVAITVVAVAIAVWWVLAPALRWASTHYVITTRRVLIRIGVLRRHGHDIPLQRLADVAFDQSLWDRMIGAGSLTLESTGEHGQETLRSLPHADRVQQVLNRLVEQDASRRRDYGYAVRRTADDRYGADDGQALRARYGPVAEGRGRG